jgi:hypothetical protein
VKEVADSFAPSVDTSWCAPIEPAVIPFPPRAPEEQNGRRAAKTDSLSDRT